MAGSKRETAVGRTGPRDSSEASAELPSGGREAGLAEPPALGGGTPA